MLNKIKEYKIKYKKYLTTIFKNGYLKSFSNSTLKSKSLLILNAIPHSIFKKEQENNKLKATRYYYHKLKEDNGINNIKFYLRKNLIYFFFSLPVVFFNALLLSFFFLFLLSPFFGAEKVDVANNYSSFDSGYILEHNKESKELLDNNIKDFGINPLKITDNIISDKNKLTLEEFKIIYKETFRNKEVKDGTDIFPQFINEGYHYYVNKNDDENIVLILSENLEIVHYKAIYETNEYYNKLVQDIKEVNVYSMNGNSINTLKKENTSYTNNKVNYFNYDFGFFDHSNPYKSIIENVEIKNINLQNDKTIISYLNFNIANEKDKILTFKKGSEQQIEINKAWLILLILLISSILDKIYFRKCMYNLEKNNQKHIMNEYKIKNNCENEFLLENNSIKHNKINIKNFKTIEI
jgi:hypothetical protein